MMLTIGNRIRRETLEILSLSIGMAAGLILLAKASFETSYDNFYEDSDRIYILSEKVDLGGPDSGKKIEEYPRTAGGIAPALKSLCPEIQEATRFTYLGEGSTFTLMGTQSKIKATYAVADSSLFDILSLPVLAGNPAEVLSSPLQAMISESLAKKIGDNAVGSSIFLDGNEKAVLTIEGIFRDFPENSDFHIDMFISMPSISYYTWDGSMNLMGNDRYFSFIKLREGADISKVEERADAFIRDNFSELLEESGTDFALGFRKLSSFHTSDRNIRNMILVMTVIALALLLTAVMNYMLLTVSSLLYRSREIAVRRCYGAMNCDIYRLTVSDAFLHTLSAVAISALAILCLQQPVSRIIGSPVGAVMQEGIGLSAVSVLAIIAVTGIVPGWIFSRIPVVAAFRSYRESRRRWKLMLLSIQFATAAMLAVLLTVISLQYGKMTDDDPGYAYDNLAYSDMSPISDVERRKLMIEELSRMPDVESVSYADNLPMWGQSGDNVMLPGDPKELFNCADLYFVGDGYLEMMEIPLVYGRTFNPSLGAAEEVMVSRRFAEYMKNTAGWEGDITGRQISITSFNGNGRTQTICGVYEDFRMGSIMAEDKRPSVMFYNPSPTGNVMIRFHHLTPEALSKAESLLSDLNPDKEIHVYSYRNDMVSMYSGTRNFRDGILAGGAVAILMVVIGLIGYTADEVARRRKEIAVRKINGATMADIVRMVTRDLVLVAIPSTLAGALISGIVSGKWLEQFSEQIHLSWWIYVAGCLFVLALSSVVAVFFSWHTSAENPADALKSE